VDSTDFSGYYVSAVGTGAKGILAIAGTSAQTLTGAMVNVPWPFMPVIIRKPSGTLTLAGTICTCGNWSYYVGNPATGDGNLNPGTSTVIFNYGNNAVVTSGDNQVVPFYNLTLDPGVPYIGMTTTTDAETLMVIAKNTVVAVKGTFKVKSSYPGSTTTAVVCNGFTLSGQPQLMLQGDVITDYGFQTYVTTSEPCGIVINGTANQKSFHQQLAVGL